MNAICKMTNEARELHDLPDDWHAWIFEAIPGALLVTGAVCPDITRGPNKGQPNYRKHDPSTKITVAVPSIKKED